MTIIENIDGVLYYNIEKLIEYLESDKAVQDCILDDDV
jgi:hypothetical protein